jgi:ribosomal protein S8E
MAFLDEDVMNNGGYDVVEEPQKPKQTKAEVASRAAVVIADLNETKAAIDSGLSEVEKRLELASYYRLLLEDSIFDNQSESAQKVNAEIRDFVRGRLEVLVGLRQEVTAPVVVESPFTPEEITALKAVADKVLKIPDIVKHEPAVPALKKVNAPTAPAKLTKPEPRRGPGRPSQESTDVKPSTQPEPTKNAHNSTQAKPKALPEGIKESVDGRKFKRVTLPTGEEFDIEVTPQAKSKFAAPTPNKQQMEMISEIQANQAIQSFTPDAAVAVTAVINADRFKEENNE